MPAFFIKSLYLLIHSKQICLILESINAVDDHLAKQTNFFHLCFFVAKPQKKTSIDGLKWRDLVVGVGR